MIYNQIVTWTAFAILAMFENTHVLHVLGNANDLDVAMDTTRE